MVIPIVIPKVIPMVIPKVELTQESDLVGVLWKDLVLEFVEIPEDLILGLTRIFVFGMCLVHTKNAKGTHAKAQN